MSLLWILCLTLLLCFVAVQADAWLSNRFFYVTKKFPPRIVRNNNLSSRKQQRALNKAEQQEEDSDDQDLEVESQEAERKRLSYLPWWEDSWSEAFLNSFPLSPLSTTITSTSTSTASSPIHNPTTPTAVAYNTEMEKELAGHYEMYQPNPSATVLHFCFLLHGHRGFSTDLEYLQRAMQHYAEQEKRLRYSNDQGQEQQQQQQQQSDMIVHCPVCNEGKTQDGVVNGGERMVQEILQVIRDEVKRREVQKRELQQQLAFDEDADELKIDTDAGIQDITVSIVGNSLGGIYGRYAIAKLAQEAVDQENHTDVVPANNDGTTTNNNSSSSIPQVLSHDKKNNNTDEFPSSVLLDGKYRLHFNIFCTTATPHLGISKHTYVPLPRSAEIGVALALGDTGKDLFRLNDLMKTMATCPTFLEPLGKFRKRVAYANAYGTDFPVPATTAAFLSDKSTYPHHFNGSTGDSVAEKKDEYIVATLHTQPSQRPPMLPINMTNATSEEEAIVDDLVQMSYSLDSLGWTKVFIDVRKEIPLRVTLPKSLNFRKSLESSIANRLRRKSSDDSIQSSQSASEETSPATTTTNGSSGPSSSSVGLPSTPLSSLPLTPTPTPPESEEETTAPPLSALQKLQQQGVVESREIASVITTPEDMRLHFPLGHNLLVALSREGFYGRMFKGGRPVMDTLAKELVQDIFDWNIQEENDALEKTLMTQSTTTGSGTNSNSKNPAAAGTLNKELADVSI